MLPRMSASPPSSASIREQAALWLARHQSGGLDGDDRRRLDAWLAADARHRREFEELCALWVAVGDLAGSPAVQAERRPAPRRRPWTWPWRPALAAVGVLLALAGILRFAGWEGPERTLHVATAGNEQREIVLDDGSRIQFDAGSTATIHLSPSSQRVVLDRGEAWFIVEHRPERRFEVETRAGRIVDIGTRFGVRLEDGERASVSVAEGEVDVSPRGGGTTRRLTAGMGLSVTPGGVGEPAPQDADAAFAWREGRLVFEGTPLREAVARMNRYCSEPLLVADRSLERMRVSGVFRIKDGPGFVWALEQTLPLRAVRRAGRIELVAIRPEGKDEPPALIR